MLLRLTLASAGVLLVSVAACSSDQTSSPDGGSTGFLPDGAPSSIDGGAPPPTCKPADVSTFKADPYHAARPQPNTCTTDAINRFYTDCLAPGSTGTTCGIFLGTDAAASDQVCAACILSRPSDPTYGPIIEHSGWQELNVAGCLEITDPTALMCAKAYQANQECEDQACKDNCMVTAADPNSLGAYQTCTGIAASVGCENFSGPAACTTMHATGAAAVCTMGNTFQAEFTAFALLFCGPHDGGVPPPADGGTLDAAPQDAPGE
jgi:hypothetical protein